MNFMQQRLTIEQAIVVTEALSVIPYFPQSTTARGIVAAELQAMCISLDSARWLVTRMAHLYTTWPGLPDLRSVYCSKFRPMDGVEGNTTPAAFPDGVPTEREPEPDYKRLSAPALLRELLAAGRSIETPREVLEPVTRRVASTVLTPAVSEADVSAILERQRENVAKRDAVKAAMNETQS